jgi:hypothetical protein
MDCPKDLIKNLVNFKKQWYLEKEISNDCKEVLRHLGVNVIGGCIFKNYNARHLHVSLSIEEENQQPT